MADFSLTDIFGANSAGFYNDSNDSWSLIIELSDLTSYGLDLSQASGTLDEYTSKIFWALLLRIQATQPASNNEDDRAIYVANQGKRTTVRNNVSQFSFGLLVNGFVNDPFGVEASPNDLV